MSMLVVDLEKESIKVDSDINTSPFRLLNVLGKKYDEYIAFSSAEDSEKDSVSLIGFSSLPLAKKISTYISSNISAILKYYGYSALIITGRAKRLLYLSVSGSGVSLLPSSSLLSQNEFISLYMKSGEEAIITGIAAERKALFSAAYLNEREILSSLYLGYLMALMGLKAVVFNPGIKKNGNLSPFFLARLEKTRLYKSLKRDGSAMAICDASRISYMPVDNFSRRFDARAICLDGQYLKERFGLYASTCTSCPVSCLRYIKDYSYAPTLRTCMALGSKNDIFSITKVVKIAKILSDYGLDTILSSAYLADNRIRDEEEIKSACILLSSGRNMYYTPIFQMGGRIIETDLRGSYEDALFYILGEVSEPKYTRYLRVRITREDIAAILALYERVYTRALADRNLPIMSSYISYISTLPRICFKSRALLRWTMRHVKMHMLATRNLLSEGLDILNMEEDERNRIPDHFIYSIDPDIDGNRSISESRLISCYYDEKRRLERYLLKRGKRSK